MEKYFINSSASLLAGKELTFHAGRIVLISLILNLKPLHLLTVTWMLEQILKLKLITDFLRQKDCTSARLHLIAWDKITSKSKEGLRVHDLC